MAPDFTLPLVSEEGQVSLARYREKAPVLLVINRGLWCSFCRRYIVKLGGTREHLQRLGVDTLVIVASDLERARLYVRHRPINAPLAADPDRIAHRAYGLPMPPMTAEIEQAWTTMRVELEKTAVTANDLVELTTASQAITAAPNAMIGGTEQIPLWDFILMQRRLYPYDMTEGEQREWDRNRTLGTGQFLIDRDGVVRWAKVQGTRQPPAGLGNFATEAELLAAAQTVTG
ncbi:MAG: redoxin domain-containing protein [bacterium]